MPKHTIKHPAQRTIYLFDYHTPISITSETSGFRVPITEIQIDLPSEVEQRAADN